MKQLLILLAIFLALTSGSCGKKDRLSEQINLQLDTLTHSLSANTGTAQLDRLTTNINSFISKYPKDSLASKYLFEVARIQQSRGQYKDAIAVLDRIEKDYAESKEVGMSVFMEGFIYANLLNDYDKAKENYELYLSKYGKENEKLANDVRMELDNLGKSADEIFKQIQQKADSLK